MNKVKAIAPGRVVAEPGAVIAQIDQRDPRRQRPGAALPPLDLRHGHARRLHRRRLGRRRLDQLGRPAQHRQRARPAHRHHGGRAARARPRRAGTCSRSMHAYGTNGIITEVEMPLDAAYDWIDVIVGFDDYMDAVRFAEPARATRTGSCSRRSPPSPRRCRTTISSATRSSSAASSRSCCSWWRRTRCRPSWRWRAREKAEILYRADTATAEEKKGLPPVYELAWNHTTLRALKRRPDHHLPADPAPLPRHLEDRRDR